MSLKVKFEKACNSKFALYVSLLSAQLNSASLLKTYYMIGSMLDWESKRNEMLPLYFTIRWKQLKYEISYSGFQ